VVRHTDTHDQSNNFRSTDSCNLWHDRKVEGWRRFAALRVRNVGGCLLLNAPRDWMAQSDDPQQSIFAGKRYQKLFPLYQNWLGRPAFIRCNYVNCYFEPCWMNNVTLIKRINKPPDDWKIFLEVCYTYHINIFHCKSPTPNLIRIRPHTHRLRKCVFLFHYVRAKSYDDCKFWYAVTLIHLAEVC